jgi:hypothetical protein
MRRDRCSRVGIRGSVDIADYCGFVFAYDFNGDVLKDPGKGRWGGDN